MVWDRLYSLGDHLHHFGAAVLLSLIDLTGPYALSPLHVVPAPPSSGPELQAWIARATALARQDAAA